MNRVKSPLRTLVHLLVANNVAPIATAVLLLWLVGALAVSVAEPSITFTNALWYSVVTLTTVGYGDIAPASGRGRVVAVILMVIGIGMFALLTGLAASLIDYAQRYRREGYGKARGMNDHIVIIGWNPRAESIYRELRTDPRSAAAQIVLLAELPETPIDEPNTRFIQGRGNAEGLERAGLRTARSAIVLGDHAVPENARDAQVILTAFAIEKMNASVYTIVELAEAENVAHAERAHVDEIVVSGEIGSHLLASAALDPGISRVVASLLSASHGRNMQCIDVPAAYRGRTFRDLFVGLKTDEECTVIGVQRGGETITNPGNDLEITPDMRLIVIR